MEAPTPPVPVLRLAKVSKAFAGVRALTDVDLDVPGGEVVALLGENGAGKSTLMKILFGVHRPDSGRIFIEGVETTAMADPRAALTMGIGLVSQEPSVVPQLDVAQNILLGQKPALSRASRSQRHARAAEVLAPLAKHLRPDARVGDLGMADRQIVEIARALARGSRIIAFDEPTSSLTPAERDGLFAVIRSLKDAGKAIIYISHRMAEIQAIADRVTVLRDGRVVAAGPTRDFTPAELNAVITGRTLAAEIARRPEATASARGEALLRLEAVSSDSVREIDLALHAGEILGVAGLVGSGRTELVRCIFGADPARSGTIRVGGSPVAIASPRDAMAAGIALIPEDRRGQSLIPVMSVEQNLALAAPASFAVAGVIKGSTRRRTVARYMDELDVRPRRTDLAIRDFSGGNQQKVVIARWLHTGARIFLFDEPTRGIDVGAKAEIHDVLRRLADGGAAVLVISSELPELLSLAHRIAVMRDFRLVETVENRPGLTEEHLMNLASGEAAW